MTPSKRPGRGSGGSIEVTPKEYERQALKWIEDAEPGVENLRVAQRAMVEGDGGDYEIDVVAELSIFEGAELRVLVECKRWSNPVKREQLLAFFGKLEDTSSHKGIVFTTSRFQRGALKYARSKGIATAVFRGGRSQF